MLKSPGYTENLLVSLMIYGIGYDTQSHKGDTVGSGNLGGRICLHLFTRRPENLMHQNDMVNLVMEAATAAHNAFDHLTHGIRIRFPQSNFHKLFICSTECRLLISR